MLAWPPPRQARVQTRCPMVLSPGADAPRAVADPDAGGCWRNAGATPWTRLGRLSAAALCIGAASRPGTGVPTTCQMAEAPRSPQVAMTRPCALCPLPPFL